MASGYIELDDPVDLLQAFTSSAGFRGMLENLLRAVDSDSPAAAVLALEGLFRIEDDVESGQFHCDPEVVRTILREWRCRSPLSGAYFGAFGRAKTFLRSLTIFKRLEVPLFIDNCGNKELLKYYERNFQTQPIPIDLNTPIVHVTHVYEAKQIEKDKKFKPSDNKNIIAGVWFSPVSQLGQSGRSYYGSRGFQTTLLRLGVAGIRQGEIVFYKKEVNVILYASETSEYGNVVRKPTEAAVKVAKGSSAYVHVSIFVPSKFLPQTVDGFQAAVEGPFNVSHSGMCVKERRGKIDTNDGKCTELVRDFFSDSQGDI